jgi:flavin reductase (DIM6/NTAB) family NADH-FMN oxidoreductase RutF
MKWSGVFPHPSVHMQEWDNSQSQVQTQDLDSKRLPFGVCSIQQKNVLRDVERRKRPYKKGRESHFMHKVIEPKILYFGTPVVLIGTRNADGSSNLAPMSSAWWLNQSCMLGMSGKSQTVINLLRERQGTLNLPSAALVGAIDRLALTTGRDPVPTYKEQIGYHYEPDKFGIAGLTPVAADLVNAPLVAECPIQLEARMAQVHPFDPENGTIQAIEMSIVRAHIDEDLLVPGTQNYIDPEKWSPLIMNFCEFFGLSGKLHHSRLEAAFYGLPRGKQAQEVGISEK